MAALIRLSRLRVADVPVHGIPMSLRTGTVRLDLGDSPSCWPRGPSPASWWASCRDAGLLADAICLQLPRAVTFGRRLLHDLAESRKPPLTLVRRGLALARGRAGDDRPLARGRVPPVVAGAGRAAIRWWVTSWRAGRP